MQRSCVAFHKVEDETGSQKKMVDMDKEYFEQNP
jgi:hypothetical protein